MQAVGLVARFQAFPHEIHVIVVKRIFKYIQGTVDYRLWYAKRREFKLKAYIDVYWEDNIDDRKSTSGAAFFLGNCLVSRVRKKQDSISLSLVESEYIAVATCCS